MLGSGMFVLGTPLALACTFRAFSTTAGGGKSSGEAGCPHCGYNHTGVAENRCPECGQAFHGGGFLRGAEAAPQGKERRFAYAALVVLALQAILALVALAKGWFF